VTPGGHNFNASPYNQLYKSRYLLAIPPNFYETSRSPPLEGRPLDDHKRHLRGHKTY